MKIFYQNSRRFGDNEYHEVSAEEMERYDAQDCEYDYEGGLAEGISLDHFEGNAVYFYFCVYC